MTSIDDVLAAIRACEEGYGLPHVEHESAADCPDVRAKIEQAMAKARLDAMAATVRALMPVAHHEECRREWRYAEDGEPFVWECHPDCEKAPQKGDGA